MNSDLRFKIWLERSALALLASCILNPASLFSQGSLTPPGAPAATMKTLTQIEPRTPISSVPFTITVPGSYYLTTNLTTTVSNAIVIATNGVTLDLSGFIISSIFSNALIGGAAIVITKNWDCISIFNGQIRGGVTNNSGTYSGSGFLHGIAQFPGLRPTNVRISGVSVSGVLGTGILLDVNTSILVESCTVRTAGNDGIRAGIVKGCVAVDCFGYAIYCDQVSDSRGQSLNYNAVNAGLALNSQGYSIDAIGLAAGNAQNCSGLSDTSTGLSANTAQNSTGHSESGDGLYALTAENCYGTSNGNANFGLRALSASNSRGYNYAGGTGLYAEQVAIGCTGFSESGTGLSANIANSCVGSTTSGAAQAVTYKYNMP